MTETNAEKLGYNEPHQYNIEELIALKDKQLERQKNASVVNVFTGEIKPFKTNINRGNYDDGTIIVEPSDTDTSNYEPLETTIERCSRSGYLAEYMQKMKAQNNMSEIDEDNNNFDFEPGYEQTPGLDLSDAKEYETNILSKQFSVSETSKSDTTNEPASANVSSSEANAPTE